MRRQQPVDTDSASVSGDPTNRYINGNRRAVLHQVGQKTYEPVGLIIHKAFREAATMVPYKDICNGTE
jgi:hypothetical protein